MQEIENKNADQTISDIKVDIGLDYFWINSATNKNIIGSFQPMDNCTRIDDHKQGSLTHNGSCVNMVITKR